METPVETLQRLLGAFETLAREERTLLAAGDYAAALPVLDREGPLVDEIARLVAHPNVARELTLSLRSRVEAIVSAQGIQLRDLSSNMTAVRSELDQLTAAQTRAHRVLPAYRREAAAAASVHSSLHSEA